MYRKESQIIVQLFREACDRRLKEETLKNYIGSNLTSELLILRKTQQETYLYPAIKECLENGNVRCALANMGHSSRII